MNFLTAQRVRELPPCSPLCCRAAVWWTRLADAHSVTFNSFKFAAHDGASPLVQHLDYYLAPVCERVPELEEPEAAAERHSLGFGGGPNELLELRQPLHPHLWHNGLRLLAFKIFWPPGC